MDSRQVADQGLELGLLAPESVLLTTLLSCLSRLFSEQVPTFLSPSLLPSLGSRWERKRPVPFFHHCPAPSKPLRKGKVVTCHKMFWNVLPWAPLVLQHPHRFTFICRRRGRCWSSCGSWPSWRGTPCTCSIRSVPSSCTTGEQGAWGTWLGLGCTALLCHIVINTHAWSRAL